MSEKEKNKGGRPRKEIDKTLFEKLCELQCTEAEICDILDVTDKTLTGWCKRTYKKGFSDVRKEKAEVGKLSLRRYQFKLAERNATMAIWLGKQYLNQKEQQTIEVNNIPTVISGADELE